MKLATGVLLVAFSIVAVADEPKVSAKPSASDETTPDLGIDTQQVVDAVKRQLVAAGVTAPRINIVMKSPGDTCYFIRTIKPAQSGPTATGFIKLQARLGPIEHGPDCTNLGGLKPSIPAIRPDAGGAAPGPVLTPVADR